MTMHELNAAEVSHSAKTRFGSKPLVEHFPGMTSHSFGDFSISQVNAVVIGTLFRLDWLNRDGTCWHLLSHKLWWLC